MNVKDLIQKQLESYGYPAPFDIYWKKVMPDEIEQAKFLTPGGKIIHIKTKHCLESAVREYGWVYMLSKLFGKETVYKVFR